MIKCLVSYAFEGGFGHVIFNISSFPIDENDIVEMIKQISEQTEREQDKIAILNIVKLGGKDISGC